MPVNEKVKAIVAAIENCTDDKGRLTESGSIKLGYGLQGMIVQLRGKRTLINLVNLDHEKLPISDGQRKSALLRKYADGTVATDTPYQCQGSALLETGQYFNCTVKPAASKQTGEWE